MAKAVQAQHTARRPALGRGLSALLPAATPPSPARGLLTLPIDQLQPERDQPRKSWDESRITELASSIQARGIIQPILVRRVADGTHRIVAGERRWRAAKKAGLTEVPVIVKDVSEKDAFEIALIENIQRQDLNPIEEAEAYQRLLSEHALKQDDLATRVGKERSSITNSLRLLKLPLPVRERVASGALSAGHAKVLLGVDDAKALAHLAMQVIERGLSVRDTERMVRRWKSPPAARPREGAPAELRSLVRRLEKAIDMPCSLDMKSPETGVLTIRFSTLAGIFGLLESMTADREPPP